MRKAPGVIAAALLVVCACGVGVGVARSWASLAGGGCRLGASAPLGVHLRGALDRIRTKGHPNATRGVQEPQASTLMPRASSKWR
jgi:hypothetical protein